MQGLPAAGEEDRVVPPEEALHGNFISRMTRPSKLDHLIIHFQQGMHRNAIVPWNDLRRPKAI
ncbi:hypothetical protein, partial [Mesorhizobium sp. M7A.F.Ca.ET.027.02.1.1]|uniref:hypothetical protein n=1 Tax=Mesorhizobium sp. M7A.F.Ca.ET.027.02.1.1 TaxID=2496655 RepID=UPI001AEC86EF